jgi:hypothetical protein
VQQRGLLEVFGNHVPIYRDPETSYRRPRPLEPNPRLLALARQKLSGNSCTLNGKAAKQLEVSLVQ